MKLGLFVSAAVFLSLIPAFTGARAHDDERVSIELTRADGVSNFLKRKWSSQIIGTPIVNTSPASSIAAAAFGRAPSEHEGSPKLLLYVGYNGNPPKFRVYDPSTGKTLHEKLLSGKELYGIAAVNDKDQSVYISTATGAEGRLFRYLPATDVLVDLGNPANELAIFNLTRGPGGTVFGGTYPSAFVLAYPGSFGQGFTIPSISKTSLKGKSYVRSISYDDTKHQLYLGSGPGAELWQYEMTTSSLRMLARAKDTFLTDIHTVGGTVFARLGSGRMLVIEPTRPSAQKSLEGVSSGVSDAISGDVYFTQATRNSSGSRGHDLMSYSLTNGQVRRRIAGLEGRIIATTVVKKQGSQWLSAFLSSGQVLNYLAPATWSTTRTEPVEVRAAIRSIARGPGGKILVSGHRKGGFAVFDPSTGMATSLGPFNQVEGFGVTGNSVFLGTYPFARVYEYNTAVSWAPQRPSAANPTLRFDLSEENIQRYGCPVSSSGQDRPFAMLAVQGLNKVFVGTVPVYGRLGGALAVYSLGKQYPTVFCDVIPNQSIVSLAYADGNLVGGTSIYGGLGAEPSEKEAILFGWSVADNRVTTKTSIPLTTKSKTIEELINGPESSIWGLSECTLFIYYPKTNAITTYENKLGQACSSHWGERGTLLYSSDGQVYAAVDGSLFRIDPTTMVTETLLASQVNSLAEDNYGRLYFSSGPYLYRYVKLAR